MLVFRRVYILPIGSLLYILLNVLPEAPNSIGHAFSNLARLREIAIADLFSVENRTVPSTNF